MKTYAFLYRLGLTPWERYGRTAATSLAGLFDRESQGRPSPPGRALDLGCGRGQYAPDLVRRGWEYVGVDNVPRAIAAARRRRIPGATFAVADVTRLPVSDLGRFDLFLDVGCFQHLDADQARAMGSGVTALANPGATLLMLEFGRSGIGSVVGGTSQAGVEQAFPGWDLMAVEPADTRGLGWPLSRTGPQWYRLAWTPPQRP